MDIHLILGYLPLYLKGAGITVYLTIVSLLLGIAIGLILVVSKMSKSKILSLFASVYISVIRGTPLLLQIIFVFYALPSFGIVLSAKISGIIALSLNLAAYLEETFRTGILAVPKEQIELAHVLGYRKWQIYVYIVFPQAIRVILPQLGNSSIAMLKDTSMVSVITITELMRTAQVVYAVNFKPFESYLLAALIYYVMSAIIEKIFKKLEKRMNYY